MVADFMKNPLQGKQFFQFRDRIMGMPNGKNIAEMRKVRDEITQNDDLQNGKTARRLESKKCKQESNGFVSPRPETEGVCCKSEKNINWFYLRDDDDVIGFHT